MQDRQITWQEVGQHTIYNDIWFVIEGNVYDPTSFIEYHPGGPAIISNMGGKDATFQFVAHGHSEQARNKLNKFKIGSLLKESQQAEWQVEKKSVDFLMALSVLSIIAVSIYSLVVLYHGPIVNQK